MNANKISYDEDMASIIVIKCLKAFSGQKSIHSLVKEPEKKVKKIVWTEVESLITFLALQT